jgi:ADP-ribose pyrophosphatase YjhB (NUDIX family)
MSDYIRGLRERIGNEVLEVPTVSVIVFDDRNRVLLVRHVEGNVWTTPGGMIEPYELPADAAVREAWEETGLHVIPQRIAGVFGGPVCSATYANGDKMAFVTTVFVADAAGGTLRPDGEETLETRYFAREDLRDVPVRPQVMLYLDAAWAQDASAHFQKPTWRPPLA